MYGRSAPERLERFTWGKDDRKLTSSLLSAAMHLFPSDNLKCIKDKPDQMKEVKVMGKKGGENPIAFFQRESWGEDRVPNGARLK